MGISEFEFKVRGSLEKTVTKYRNSIPQKAMLKLIEEIIQIYNTLHGEWIPVTERLPDKSGDYITVACDEGAPHGEGIWYNKVVVIASYCDGRWTWYENETEYDLSDIVTHWMPFPQPAEVQCNG